MKGGVKRLGKYHKEIKHNRIRGSGKGKEEIIKCLQAVQELMKYIVAFRPLN